MTIFRKFFIFFSVVLIADFSWAADISLSEAINATYENNPELKARNYSLEAVKSQKQKSYGGFMPKVSADINSGAQKNKVGDNSATHTSYNSKSFTVSQDLFNGGSTIFDIKRAESEVQKGHAEKKSKEQEIFFGLINSYFDVLRYEELLIIEMDNMDSQEKLLEYTKKKAAARDATKSELAKASADYSAAVNNKDTTANDLISAKIVLSRYTGIPFKEIGRLRKIDADFFMKKLDLNVKNLLDVALQSNPELAMEKHGVESAKQQSYIAKSSLSPTVRANYSVTDSKNAIYFNNRQQKNEVFYVNVHVPLFNSGVEYATIGEANNNLQSHKYSLDATRNRLIQEVKESVTKINNLKLRYEAAVEQENANQIYVNALKEEERLGTKSIIDLLVARRDLHAAKLARIGLYYDKIMAMFELKVLLGELSYESVVSIESK